jgi:uncharacterized protein YcnI
MRRLLPLVLLALLWAAPVRAHVVLSEPTAAAGSYHVTTFIVGHGCGTGDTVALRIAIPDGVLIARPQPKPGWQVELAMDAKTDLVSAITWRGGRLPHDQFDMFSILMHLPKTPGRLYFPTVQSCTQGESRWVERPVAGQAEPAFPAPVLTVVPATADAHGH